MYNSDLFHIDLNFSDKDKIKYFESDPGNISLTQPTEAQIAFSVSAS